MTIRLYHQVGHFPSWNLDSFVKDQCGDGLILSPVHQSKAQVEKLGAKVRRASFFDPQYYLPNSQKSKLHTYPFFPETLSGGFSTKGFAALALESAKQCLQFQVNQQFEKLIIPARYFDQMDPEYGEKQEIYTVAPFLKAAARLGGNKPIILTLPLTSHMIESEKYRKGILNWVTSFSEISGVYVIAANDRETKQVQSKDFLSAYLEFLHELSEADLDLTVGYLNTEGLLLTLLEDINITFGTFENTRIFSLDKFVVNNEDRRGPKARIYLPALMNWIQFDQARQIKAASPNLWSAIYERTEYADEVLAARVDPTFNQPQLYKHFFLCFSNQVSELAEVDRGDRYQMLNDWIERAASLYKQIRSRNIILDKHGGGGHLPAWSEAIRQYFDDYL